MIEILPGLAVPENELRFAASRSGGPGGQNVNKVSTRVTLAFDVSSSAALSAEQKERVLRKLASRINKEGILQIVSQRTRSQELNREDAVERFAELLRRALTPERVRIKTRRPAASREKRLGDKKKRAQIKTTRSERGWDS
jgi:ribosome-associated protein